jgi:hypothetical protein
MSPRPSGAAVLAWSLWSLWAALCGVAVWLAPTLTVLDMFWLAVVGYATVGALVASRHPGNAMGWLMLVFASLVLLQFASESLAEQGGLPAQVAGAWAAGWLWYLWLSILLVFFPLLAPTGSLPSRRWRPVLWVACVGLLAAVVGAAFKPGPTYANEGPDNPVAAPGPWGEGFTILELVGDALLLAACLLAVGSLAVRFRRSVGTERQQLKWFAYALVLMFTGWALFMVSNGLPDPWSKAVEQVGWLLFLSCMGLLLPAAIGIAIFRHRLYDIDLVINRTLVYAALTATLLATYALSVIVLGRILNPLTGDSALAVAASTLAVAALFRPARRRIQNVVDRRFYRSRYDATRILADFTTRLRHELDLDAVSNDLRSAAERTLQPTHVTLWLRR